MRTRLKRAATHTWRSLGCRTTPLKHWSKRKPTVEPRWAKQRTKKLRPHFCISAEIWLLPADLRHLSVNSSNHHTQASNSIISVFLTNCSVSIVRGLLCNLTLLKGREFPVVSQSTRGIISKNRTE